MRVDIGGGTRLFVDVVGSSLDPTPDAMVPKPALVLLHGGPGSDHSSFRPYFDRFADTHQVVYVDHRGQGRSDERKDPSGWDLDTWADDVVRLCDALEIERPVVLGLSFGGFVAIRYAARHPAHPSQVVLVEHARPAGRRAHRAALPRARRARRRRPATTASTSTATRARRRGPTTPASTCRSTATCRPASDLGGRGTTTACCSHFHEHFFDMDLRDDVRRIEAPDPRAGGSRRPDDAARAAPPRSSACWPTGSGSSRSSTAPGTAPTATSPSAPSRSSGSSSRPEPTGYG